ncbi:hypothetical protein AAZX31_13G154200 [Glycine max]|nr:hypothetical protein GYH30_036492 [Glycine max]
MYAQCIMHTCRLSALSLKSVVLCMWAQYTHIGLAHDDFLKNMMVQHSEVVLKRRTFFHWGSHTRAGDKIHFGRFPSFMFSIFFVLLILGLSWS